MPRPQASISPDQKKVLATSGRRLEVVVERAAAVHLGTPHGDAEGIVHATSAPLRRHRGRFDSIQRSNQLIELSRTEQAVRPARREIRERGFVEPAWLDDAVFR